MDNETKISLQFNNGVNGQKKLEEYTKQLEKIYALTSALNSDKASKTLGEINSTIKVTEQNTKDLKTKSKDLSKVFATAFSIGKVVAFGRAVQKISQTLTKFVQSSSSYIENVNLLEVAYKNANETIEESSNRIETFIDKMADLYGLDESNLTRQFGVFKQMANAMQLPTETAEHLSEIMVKMTNDVASLYNLDLNRASNALQSALTGQTRPIRGATGADITEKTLQNTVDALNLDRNISQLSYVEKRLVMVISLTNQLKQSQGDYARTIESTANQFRILGEQWSRLTRSVGNVFYNLLGGILPYLNGILMALTEIFNLIASLMGFEMPEFDYSGLSGVSDVALDIEDALDGAGASADTLKNKLSGLRGFDKLNVISTPKSSGVSASAGVGGAIDPKILEEFNKAFADYDDMMGSVKMKARDIRDSIMKWLGFTKEINPLTGDVSWKYEGIGKTFSNIWESIKKLSPEMQLVVAGITAMVGSKIISGISTLISGFEKLVGWTNEAGETLKGFNKTNIDYWSQNMTMAQRFTTALIGVGGVVAGLTMVSDAMKKISDEGLNAGNALEGVGGFASSIFGGAMIGASTGAGLTGVLVGGAVGGVSAIITALASYKSEAQKTSEAIIKSLEPIKQSIGEINKQFEDIENLYSQEFLRIGVHSALLDELEKIVDENGKIKKGYEDRANFITTTLSSAYGIEIEIIDGIIQKYDEKIGKIRELIEKKKQEYAYQKMEERYKLAIEEQTNAFKNLSDAKAKFQEAQKKEQEYMDKWEEKWEKNTNGIRNSFKSYEEYIKAVRDTADHHDLMKALYKSAEAFGEAEKSYKTTQEAVLEYEGAVEAMASNNQEAIDYYVNKEMMAHGQEITSYSELVDEAKWSYSERIRIAQERGQEINDVVISSANERYRAVGSILAQEVKDVKDITPDYVKAWSEIGKHSTSVFLQYFKKLPTEVQQDVVNKMYDLGYDISEELQEGITQINPEIKFKADTSAVDYAIDRTQSKVNGLDWLVKTISYNASSAFDGLKNLFKADGGIFYNGGWHNIAGYADGGLPPVGQMFVARENGAELVGTINNHTAVMNNDQIVDSVADGVYRAVVNANATTQQARTNVTIPVQIGTKEIGRIIINDLQKMAKTNGKPIVIGG